MPKAIKRKIGKYVQTMYWIGSLLDITLYRYWSEERWSLLFLVKHLFPFKYPGFRRRFSFGEGVKPKIFSFHGRSPNIFSIVVSPPIVGLHPHPAPLPWRARVIRLFNRWIWNEWRFSGDSTVSGRSYTVSPNHFAGYQGPLCEGRTQNSFWPTPIGWVGGKDIEEDIGVNCCNH